MFRTKRELENLCVDEKASLRKAIKKMDAAHRGIILIIDRNSKLKGIITDGDFRRLVLNGVGLNIAVYQVMNKDAIMLNAEENNTDPEHIKKIFIKEGILHLPIIKDDKIADLIFETDLFWPNSKKFTRNTLNIPVVIMAGGKGTRLHPFTRILPKPLIPIGNKTIIEIIMEKFVSFGMKNFYVTVNHKAKMIKVYFEDRRKDYNITFIDENKPLGTVGALKKLNREANSSFFISNCDIIIEADYLDIYQFHEKKQNELTIVASMQHHVIPYGICEIENGGKLKDLKEKPEYDFLINSGFYILNSENLKFIPDDQYFDMTDLINVLRQNNKKIGVYPISGQSWIDIGQWKEYKKSLNKLLTD